MDIETLERRLGELTDIERAYRDGSQRDWRFPPELLACEDGRVRIKKSLFLDLAGGRGVGCERKSIPLDQSLFVFRVLRFEPAPEHVHDFIEINYVYRGSCAQRVNGQELTLCEGQVLLLDSDCPHLTYPLGKDDIVFSICVGSHLLQESLNTLRLSRDWLTVFLADSLDEQADHNRFVLFRSEGDRRIRSLFQELVCEYIDPSPNAERMLLGMFQLLLVDLLNVFERDIDRDAREAPGHRSRVISIINYIEENFLTCTLESVAGRFFVSPNYISRILKKSVGKTYQQLVQEMRLSHAANLIGMGGYSAEEAARAAGYTNMSFFYRKFRETFGLTPAEYRTNRLA